MSQETASFALGCFWDSDALFGGLNGVIRTRVGYSGGEKEDPNCQDIGNHTETVQIDYDPEEITYGELLEKFWEWHNYAEQGKERYESVIFYHNEKQRKKAEESRPDNAVTRIRPMKKLWMAEKYHQKYRLRGSDRIEEYREMDPEEFRESSEVAEANAEAYSKMDYSSTGSEQSASII